MKLKRGIALYIDLVIAAMISYVFLGVITDGTYELTTMSFIAYGIVYFTLTAIKDIVFKNRSLGKRMLSLKIVNYKGEFPSKSVLILRNIIMIPTSPILIFLYLFSDDTISDIILKTRVVNARDNKNA